MRHCALAGLVCLTIISGGAAQSKKPHSASAKSTGSEAVSPADGRVTDVRFWSVGEATRVAIEVNQEFEYRTDRLENPDRIFFDILGTKPAKNPNGIEIIPVNDAFVRQIRVAQTVPGRTRIVLDVKANVQTQVSQLANPDRLMIEIRPGIQAPSPSTVPAAETTTASAKVFEPPPEKQAALPPAPKLDAPKTKVAPPSQSPSLERAVRASAEPPSSAPAVSSEPVETLRTKTAAESRGAKVETVSPADTSPTPLAAKPGSKGDRSMTRVLGLKLGRIVLDPGHGGHDVGTRGPTGLLEKDLVLDVARRLGALIEERLGSEVVFTRSDDTFIALEERTRIANRQEADLFLSIHANSSSIKSVSGVETYYLNFTTNKSALEVAARENASSERKIYDLHDLVQKITLNDKVGESREFAGKVQTSMAAFSARSNKTARDRGVRKAPFVVLIGASMPSILAEIGFVSNPQDEAMMKKPEYRQKLAETLYKGVSQYAGGLSRFQVAGQRRPAHGGE
jgi:N-acetylmuramoyl-L-alanine amidase